ncbi:hypothetical protein HR45_13620 [Shewanella mangrovi]|uniref:Uncharacterized protein n=1 Tax=Shewanella mangrovi TaxID=1515746 RepID=A0A094JAE3_9GAMM|nr:WYL domain-containing protein [Shewanella mangrovi]KFZ36840.1 hypothetical protein HR45_13620 [Shewanella mangrovi]
MRNTLLASRLAELVSLAYAGKVLLADEMAEKYAVSTKTIKRDFERLNEILERCPHTGGYRLIPSARTIFNENDLAQLVDDIGLKKAFPRKTAIFLRSFINDQTSQCYHFQEQPLEADFITSLHTIFERAIINRQAVQFLYKDKSRIVQPYLMVYSHGSWYLAATEEGMLKAFSLARLKFASVKKENFEYDESVVRQIKEQETIWFGTPLFSVTLEIKRDIAFYFERKALLPKQEILEKRSDGTLVVSASAWSYNQIAPIVQYWLPNIRVISPLELDEHIRKNLTGWMTQTNNVTESITE